ncbi:MAG: hypothetical protein GXY08_12620, partial [Ruminococcus sp.]|nr:hypothetical protein [Ruminococcus sp.]
LRAESVSGQLAGTIPSTTEGQKADSSALINTDGLNTSDMGSMGGGMGGFGGGKGGFGRNSKSEGADSSKETAMTQTSNTSSLKMLGNVQFMSKEEKSDKSSRPQRGSGNKPDFGGDMPEGFDPENMPDFDGDMPEGFEPGNMPGGSSQFGDPEKSAEDISDDDTDAAEKPAGYEDAASSDNNENAAPGKRSAGGERPDMGSFSPMDDSSKKDNTTAYVLLGASAFALLIGLGFALKFRR